MSAAKRRGLGRGLDALLQPEEAAAVDRLPLARLVPNQYQPRTGFDPDDLRELADSIRSQGLIQPIVVTPRDGGDQRYTIIAGERRFRAARLAGLEEVPVVVREVEDERELLELALVENLQRSDLDPMEEAEAYRRLSGEFGLSQEEIGTRVGKGRTTISNALRLLRLPEEVQEMLRSGRLTAGQARPLIPLEDPERQLRLARRAAEKGLTAREMERAASDGESASGRRRREREVDVHTADAEEKLTRALQTKVEIHRRGEGGAVQIRFYSEEELIRLFELLIDATGGKR